MLCQNLSTCMSRSHIRKYKFKLNTFLTSAVDRGEWVRFTPGRFTLGERALDTH